MRKLAPFFGFLGACVFHIKNLTIITSYKTNLFDPCVFIGYAHLQKGYKCLHVPSKRVYIYRHVIFDETSFPFRDGTVSLDTNSAGTSASIPTGALDTVLALWLPAPSDITCELTSSPASVSQQYTNSSPMLASSGPDLSLESPSLSSPISTSSPARIFNEAAQPSLPPDRLPSLHTDPIPQPEAAVNRHPMITRTQDNTRRSKLMPEFVAYLSTLETEPATFSQAQKHACWRESMTTEMAALATNHTWTLVPPPDSHNIIGCKWVYKIKRRADGTIERYKACLVAKGAEQRTWS